MAGEVLTTTTQVDPGMEIYYDRLLLEAAKADYIMGKFAVKKSIPRGSSKKIKFRRYSRLTAATTPLTEGITPTGSQLAKTDLEAEAQQYGDFVHLTDVVDLVNEDPLLARTAIELSEQLNLTADNLTREILKTALNVTTCSTGGTELNEADIDAVVSNLIDRNAKPITSIITAGAGVGTTPISPAYYALANTTLYNKLKRVTGWVEAKDYAKQGSVMPMEYGATGRVRWLLSTEGHNPADDDEMYFNCFILGQNAYGTIDLDGGNAKNIVHQQGSAGSADPLNQVGSSGWKIMFTARVLNDDFMEILKCSDT